MMALVFPAPTLRAAPAQDSSGIPSKTRRVITVDGRKYPTLQSAIDEANRSCTAGVSCVIDARNPALGAQLLTRTDLAAVPVTLLTGPYTIRYDASTLPGLTPTSNFRWIADRTRLTPYAQNSVAACVPGTPLAGLINPAVLASTGSTTANSKTVTLAHANSVQVGSMVAILAQPFDGSGLPATAAGTQSTSITQKEGIEAGSSSVEVASTSNFGPAVDASTFYNYLLIDREVVRYDGADASHFTSLARGLFGTTATPHTRNAMIYQFGWFASEVSAITGNRLTLSEPAPFTVANAPAQVGSTNISIEGTLTLDGNLTGIGHLSPRSGCTSIQGIGNWLVSNETVGPDVKIQNTSLGAIMSFMSRHNHWAGHFVNNGMIVPLPSSAASGNGSISTLTLTVNPLLFGFTAGGVGTVQGFSGADACFNAARVTWIAITSTQISYANHCPRNAASVGTAYQFDPPAFTAGADINCFNCRYNVIRTGSHTGGYFGLLLDDRSTIAAPYMGSSSFNWVNLGEFFGPYGFGAVEIEGGSSYNYVKFSKVDAGNTAVGLVTSNQWTTDPDMLGNRVDADTIDSAGFAVNLQNGSAAIRESVVHVGHIHRGSVNTAVAAQSGNRVKIGGKNPTSPAPSSIVGRPLLANSPISKP
jgi:hypothetical protein